jgi:hypothetical protein
MIEPPAPSTVASANEASNDDFMAALQQAMINCGTMSTDYRAPDNLHE